MNLDGKGLFRVQELQQQGESGSGAAGELLSPAGENLSQAAAAVTAVGSMGFAAGKGGDFQAFTGGFIRDILVETLFQGAAAPGRLLSVAERRRHYQRIEFHSCTLFLAEYAVFG